MKSGIMQPNAITYFIRIELAKESDLEFLKSGVETNDIYPNMKRHDLENSEEYKKIMADINASSD